eukprot:1929846-Lingulodinium_polyedra.AAC.1
MPSLCTLAVCEARAQPHAVLNARPSSIPRPRLALQATLDNNAISMQVQFQCTRVNARMAMRIAP